MDRSAIICLPHPTLRTRSKPIRKIDADSKRVAQNMIKATLDWQAHRSHEIGVALAAPQVDHRLRLIIVKDDFADKVDKKYNIYINPEIIRREGQPVADYEGCLSIKDVYGLVPRYPKVKFKATDENGRIVKQLAKGFLARVLQHEIDHLDGVMFVDHVKDDNFFKITDSGELIKLSNDEYKTYHILRH